MPKLALVTCLTLPEPDPDEEITLSAFQRAGIDATLAAWDDPQTDWSQFDLAVLRSTWNYYEDETAFRQWIDSTAAQTQLLNSSALVHRNIDKIYLRELETLGVEIVPTRFLTEKTSLADVLNDTGWQDFVIKPTVSAGSFMTKRFHRSNIEDAKGFVERLTQTHRAMIEDFMPLVERGGEIALVHIDGELTHGVVKQPRFADGEESVSPACQPSEQQARIAQKVMASIAQPWLYARVDLMASTDGRWLLSELELIEPSLFFLQNEKALDRFTKALSSLL